MQERVSADPDDPEIRELRQQLELLGPVPSRRAISHQQEMELWNWAEAEVAAGRVRYFMCELVTGTVPVQGLYMAVLSRGSYSSPGGAQQASARCQISFPVATRLL